MKSAYELAMERLNKQSPTIRLTDGQKKEIAELESKCKARVAERELALADAMSAAAEKGDFAESEKLQQQLAQDKQKLAAEFAEKKEAVRRRKS